VFLEESLAWPYTPLHFLLFCGHRCYKLAWWFLIEGLNLVGEDDIFNFRTFISLDIDIPTNADANDIRKFILNLGFNKNSNINTRTNNS